jgi:coenzyme PQQ precursor peptide PqqA
MRRSRHISRFSRWRLPASVMMLHYQRRAAGQLENLISFSRKRDLKLSAIPPTLIVIGHTPVLEPYSMETIMKTWMKPTVREQEVGLEVTSYLPAEIDLI